MNLKKHPVNGKRGAEGEVPGEVENGEEKYSLERGKENHPYRDSSKGGL